MTTPNPRGNKARREAAIKACCLASVWAHQQNTRRVEFDLDNLPQELRLSAAALMHAALSHYLCPPWGKPVEVLHWSGHAWALTPWLDGRLHIAMQYGAVGLLTPPCPLLMPQCSLLAELNQ